MENNLLFIPRRLKVGYNYREDTYSKFLAFVIYYDQTKKLRKEKSFLSWIETEEKEEESFQNREIYRINNPNVEPYKKRPVRNPEEFDNIPISGFVLNKGVGGVKDSSSSWNPRNEYIRVYDPRGFEFEISIANLLFILQETNSIVGKGLEGEFVYSWLDKELVLLPCNSNVYKQSKEYSDNLYNPVNKVTKKDLKPLTHIKMINGDEAVYLGKTKVYMNSWTDDTNIVDLCYNITRDYFFKQTNYSNIKAVIGYDYKDIDVLDIFTNCPLNGENEFIYRVLDFETLKEEFAQRWYVDYLSYQDILYQSPTITTYYDVSQSKYIISNPTKIVAANKSINKIFIQDGQLASSIDFKNIWERNRETLNIDNLDECKFIIKTKRNSNQKYDEYSGIYLFKKN